MAHYATLKPTSDPDIFDVVEVSVFSDDETETDVIKKTSYNTFEGKHLLGGIPLRKNYAGVGYVYDKSRDAFYLPQPYPSWALNEDTATWEPPVKKPDEDSVWNESTQTWDAPVLVADPDAPPPDPTLGTAACYISMGGTP